MRRFAPQRHAHSALTLRVRIAGTLTLLGLVAGLGFFASRPAHTAGGPIAVNVANTPLAVTPTDAAALRHPFAVNVFPSLAESGSFTVPAGKRLVIQQISALAFTNTVQDLRLFSTISGQNEINIVPFTSRNGPQKLN